MTQTLEDLTNQLNNSIEEQKRIRDTINEIKMKDELEKARNETIVYSIFVQQERQEVNGEWTKMWVRIGRGQGSFETAKEMIFQNKSKNIDDLVYRIEIEFP